MGVKILFFSRGTLGQNSMFPEKGGQNSIFFPSALKKGGQNRGAYQPTSLKGCPPQGGDTFKLSFSLYPLIITSQSALWFGNFPGEWGSLGRHLKSVSSCRTYGNLEVISLQRCHLTSIGIPIFKIRGSLSHLSFITGNPILARWQWHLYIELAHWSDISFALNSSFVDHQCYYYNRNPYNCKNYRQVSNIRRTLVGS